MIVKYIPAVETTSPSIFAPLSLPFFSEKQYDLRVKILDQRIQVHHFLLYKAVAGTVGDFGV